MKKYLLVWLISTVPVLVNAQIPISLLTSAASIGVSALRNGKQASKPDPTVTIITYQGQSFPQKRTPENKLKGKGAQEVIALESLLQACYNRLLSSPTDNVCTTDQYTALVNARTRVELYLSTEKTAPYAQETDFYLKEQQRREHAQYMARMVLARREDARRDSLYRVAARAKRATDSLTAVAQLRSRQLADSVYRASRLNSNERYVNATKLNMRASASAQAKQVASVYGASLVQVLSSGNGWSKIKASDYTGYVKSEYLVPTLDEVTAPGVDVDTQRQYGNYVGVEAWEPQPMPVARPAARKATGDMVYMCDSGNTVKYHASPDCRGLNRCGADIVKVSKSEAQQSMDPCKFCY